MCCVVCVVWGVEDWMKGKQIRSLVYICTLGIVSHIDGSVTLMLVLGFVSRRELTIQWEKKSDDFCMYPTLMYRILFVPIPSTQVLRVYPYNKIRERNHRLLYTKKRKNFVRYQEAVNRAAISCINHSGFSLDFYFMDHMRKKFVSRIRGFFQSFPGGKRFS